MAGAVPGVRVMSLRVLDAGNELGNVADLASAILYADSFGVRVINLSIWGMSDFSIPTGLEDAIALSSPDAVFVAAAGNFGDDLDEIAERPVWPCEVDDPRVICVAATGPTGSLWVDSNYGDDKVDLAAPGDAVCWLKMAVVTTVMPVRLLPFRW